MPAPQGYVALDLVGFTDKGDYAAGTTYAQNDLVHSANRIYLSLQDNNIGQALPVSPAIETAFWKLWLSGGGDDLEALTAEDTSNVTGGGAGQVVVAQTLIDAIANKVMNDLVAKSQIINNLLATQAGNVLDATQGKALKDEIDQLYSDMQNKAIGYLDIQGSNKFVGFAVGEHNPSILINPVEKFLRLQFTDNDNQSKIYDYQLIGNADLDGHIAFLSSGETALEAGSGNTRYRLQIDTVGNVLIFKSTDGGSTWPTSKVIASM